MKRHWALAALLACAAPLLLAFTRQAGLASVGDDSAAYLVLAQYFAASAAPAAAWAPHFGHFPPLLPLVLAATGAASDLARAHLVVGAFAALALAAIYAFAWTLHGRRDAALGLALIFVLLPTAWIGAKGILSEPMFLAASLAALAFHQARLAQGAARNWEWLALGALLALALLTRLAAVALIAACALQAALRMAGTGRFTWRPLVLAAIPVVVLAGLWMGLRPGLPSDPYQRATQSIAALWLAQPAPVAAAAAHNLFEGWVAGFTADPDVSAGMRMLAALIGCAAAAGAVRAALRNRADGWYVLAALAIAYLWVFNADNMRRLLYPLVPLMLLHAGEAVAAACSALGARRHAVRVLAACAAGVALLALPAMLLVFDKARDRAPVLAGFHTTYADITDYYATLNQQRARALAAKHAAVLSGLEALAVATRPGTRTMWMRPEYVALLGQREGVPWFYGWDARRIAREVRDARVDFLVVARLHKTDLAGAAGDPFATLRGIEAYTRPVLVLPNAVVGGEEFVLVQVEPAALAAFLAAPR